MNLICYISILVLCSLTTLAQQTGSLNVWYNRPADARSPDVKDGWQNDAEWLKALPIGNGFLGAMVFGDVNYERIQLNEKTLWSGSPHDNDNPEARASLPLIRKLLFEGKYKEARALTLKTQVCKDAGTGGGNSANLPYGCFQTLGDLNIDFLKNTRYSQYQRKLDLHTGIQTIIYQQDGVNYKREIFASYPDRAIVIRISADRKNQLNFNTRLSRPERFTVQKDAENLLMTGVMDNGKAGEGMRYAVRLKALATGGTVSYTHNEMQVKAANEVVLIVTAATSYKQDFPAYTGDDPGKTSLQQLNKAIEQPFATLKKNHVTDYTALFSKLSLELGSNIKDTVPTDVRLQQQQQADDLHLQKLYFQYGRYLLISSSREGSLPANLQGMWSNKIQTPWNCDYHININLQMNYWPALVTNLAACSSPLTNFITSLVTPGTQTAKTQYGMKGWVAHSISNVWCYTSPGEHPSWGLHTAASGWLCQHLWDYYAFTLDKQYLERVYPVMLGAAQFYLNWLVPDPVTGKLLAGPAASPENTFYAPDGSVCDISMGPAHDQQIIHELFTNLLQAAAQLQNNDPLIGQVRKALPLLAGTKIGADGRLMEWQQPFREVDPRHRHVSHLYMLYPGNQLNIDKDPDLAAAARKSLEVRTDVGTGWSLAWKVNFWARLKDGDRAYTLLKNLLTPSVNYKINMSNAGGTYPNLFCGHPPYQIDGNFGATAGIAELLLQSHQGYIDLLPALPTAWKEGEVKGLVARGAAVVDIRWRNKKLVAVKVFAGNDGKLTIKYQDKVFEIPSAKKGKTYVFDENLVLK